MKRIHQLSSQIVSKIAAGEVIERPVFAVKELVENAIDAKADVISISIEESGLRKITVVDNGIGIEPEDLQESIKPHTTSKLSNEDELSHISTLGFRGEALASIAAISRVTLNSRIITNSAGTSIIIKNGKTEKISPIGMPVGTTVIVDQLFYTLPARKKFLKSARTEFHHILELILGYALSYPNIHFVLFHNKRAILDLPKSDDPLVRIEKLLGKDIFSSLLPISYTNSYISLTGYIAKPAYTTRTPSKQFLFINKRVVSDKGISLSIKSAYGNLLANNVYPICILNISLPYEMVDVNVHPRKEYVRFVDTHLLYDSIGQAVREALRSYDLMPDSSFGALFLRDAVGSTDSYAGKLLKEKKLPWELSTKFNSYYSTLTQLHDVYLFMASDNGFVLIDQHAAHERILYEQFHHEFVKEKEKNNLFLFSKPGVFDLSISETNLLQENIILFQGLGWAIEHFKNNTFIIRSLPVIFQDRDYVKLLREMLEDIKENGKQKSLDDISNKMIAYLACRGAIKAGDRLTKKRAEQLIKQLEKTPNSATCPHGRPTKIAVDLERINKLFKR